MCSDSLTMFQEFRGFQFRGFVAIGFVLRFLDDEDGYHGLGAVGRLASVSGFDFVRIGHILQDLHHGSQYDARQILPDCVVCRLITLNLDCHYYNSQSTHKPLSNPPAPALPPGGRLTNAGQGRFWRSGARWDCQWDTAVPHGFSERLPLHFDRVQFRRVGREVVHFDLVIH